MYRSTSYKQGNSSRSRTNNRFTPSKFSTQSLNRSRPGQFQSLAKTNSRSQTTRFSPSKNNVIRLSNGQFASASKAKRTGTSRLTSTSRKTASSPRTGRTTATSKKTVARSRSGRITATSKKAVSRSRTGRITATSRKTASRSRSRSASARKTNYPRTGRMTTTSRKTIARSRHGRIAATSRKTASRSNTGRFASARKTTSRPQTGRFTTTSRSKSLSHNGRMIATSRSISHRSHGRSLPRAKNNFNRSHSGHFVSSRNSIHFPQLNGQFNSTGFSTNANRGIALHNPVYKLFVNEVRDLYNTENQILRELPKLAKAATSSKLKDTLRDNIKETQGQVKRLQVILRFLGEKARPQQCQGISGIIKEGQACLAREPRSTGKDVAIISAAQKVEHYEIAAYGTAKAHAKRLALPQIANLLNKTLGEESAADRKLTKVADGSSFWTGLNNLAAKKNLAYSR